MEHVELERFRLILLTYLNGKLMNDFGEELKLDISAHESWIDDLLTVRIIQTVWGETLGTLEIEKPATWWDMWKRDHAPRWFLGLFPVRYLHDRYDARVLYPKIKIPDEAHNYTWIGPRRVSPGAE
jgi:hypothetical protein